MTVAKRGPAPWRHAVALGALALAACGGGGNPLTNPQAVDNTADTQNGRKLSFTFFQKCVNDIFITPLPININGAVSINTCAGSGCHDQGNGTGGAFRVYGTATAVNLASTPEAIRATDMYRNYYSAQGEVIVGAALKSLLLDKPLVLNALHGGGLIFPNTDDPNVKIIRYWIEHPVPAGQDEFSVPEPATCVQP
jgi:hypothetical protein